jgi:hypothetical protein
MIPWERGLRGISHFIIFLFTHNCFNGERWLDELLGGRPCGS